MALPTMITTEKDLQELCAILAESSRIAVDTEFVWTRTYFPHLGTVQLGSDPEHVFIVDAVAIKDPTALKELMANETVMKIFHDAGQDIAIVNRWTGGETVNVFDTQFASGFTGMGASMSLQKMTKELVDVELEKGATRTDWLKRPLDPVQVSYALDDVRYMPECSRLLEERAEKRGTLALMQQAFTEMASSDVFSFERGLKRHFNKCAGRLRHQHIDKAYRLVLWLEEMARKLNKPREHVLRKEILVQLATSSFATLDEMKKAPFVNERLFGQFGQELLDILHGEERAPKEWVDDLRRPKPDTPEMKVLIDAYGKFIKNHIASFDIDSVLVMNKAKMTNIVRRYARHNEPVQLKGWRGELVNKASADFFAAEEN